MRLSVDSTSLSFNEVSGKAPEAKQLRASVSPLSKAVYIGVAFTGSGLASVSYDISGQSLPIVVTPKQPEAAGSGIWTDQVIIAACLDENCKEHVAGSPAIVSVTYTVHSRLGASPTELSFTHALGSNAPPSSTALSVQSPASSHWAAAASPSWIRLSGSTHGTTPGELSVGVDPSGLPLGTFHGSVTLTATKTGETVDVPVTLQVKPASLSTTPRSLSMGGVDGLELAAQPLALRLDTGDTAHDWTAEVDTGGGPQWLKLSSTSGKASSTATTLTVRADPTGLKDGIHSGTVRFTSSVADQTVTQDVPVTLLLAPHKLWVPDNGVGLVSTPSVSRLTHTVKVKDNWGLSTVPWTASSEQPWLSVTPSGTGGGNLTLTANPQGLAQDTIHYATVTLRYDDGLARGSDTVRVGLWVGSQSPKSQSSISFANSSNVLVTDPIRPYVYVQHTDETVDVYNLYTASLVTRLTRLGGYPGRMAVSSDGSTLYILLTTSNRILPVDLNTLTVGASTGVGGAGSPYGLTYVRPNGHGLVLINGGTIYDPSADAVLPALPNRFGYISGASLEGSLACGGRSDGSTVTPECYGLRYSDVGGGLATVTLRQTGQRGWAINQDGSRVYFAGLSKQITVHDGQTLEPRPPLTLPDYCCSAMAMGPEDRLYVAGESFSPTLPQNVWVYDNAGMLLDTYRFDMRESVWNGQLQVSGDGRRLAMLLGYSKLVFVTTP